MTRKRLESLLKIRIIEEPDKKCWFIKGRDWSNYSNIRGSVGHRLVFDLCVGPLIPGKEICHRCDRKGCINPKHLFQGSHSANMQDAMKKGRLRRFRIKNIKTITAVYLPWHKFEK